MVDRRLLSYDPYTGIKRTFEYDHSDDTFSIITEQDWDDIGEANQQARNDAPTRWGDMAKVASIPLTVYYDLIKKGIIHDQAALKKWLNDPENQVFRTRGGRV